MKYSVVPFNLRSSIANSIRSLALPLICSLLGIALVAQAGDIRDGLVSYWPLDENTGGKSADQAFTNAMSVVGSPTVSAGQRSNAFTFNGSSVYLTNAHAGDNTLSGLPIYRANGGAFTIAMWVKAQGVSGNANKYVYTEAGPGSSGPLFLMQHGSSTSSNFTKLDIYMRNDANVVLLNHAVSASVVFDNTWHHIAFVDDSGRARLYVDGVPDGTSFNHLPVGSFTMNWSTLGALVRLPTATSGFFNGQIDDVAVWERALSVEEINQVRTNGIQTPAVPLVPGFHGLPPADLTRQQGDWATFTMPLYGSRPYVTTFQWSSNGIPIPGATGRTYQTPPGLQPEASGSVFSVAVSNDLNGFWFISTNATLTIQPDATLGATNGLVNYWPLDAFGPLTNAADLHYGQDMLMRNVNTNTQIVGGQYSNAVVFFPNDSTPALSTYGVRTGGSPIYNNANYTVAMWVMGNGTGRADTRVFSEGSSVETTTLWSLGVDAYSPGSSSMRPFFRTSSNTVSVANYRRSTRPVFDGNWHHVVWTDANGAAKLYVDGVLDETDFTYTRQPLALNLSMIGVTARASVVTPFSGSMDEVATWNRALTWSEVQQIMTNGVPIPTAVDPPSITSQPVDQTNSVYAGDDITFGVGYTGSAPMYFQWFKNTNGVISEVSNPSAVTSALLLTNVQVADSNTTYSVVLSNAAGSVTSSIVRLYVLPYTPSTNGEVLKVDFGVTGSPNAQPGFSEMLGLGPVDVGTIKVTFSGVSSGVDTRLRSTVTNLPPNLTQAQIYNDFAFASANGVDTGMRVLIQRLAPNTPYGLTVWSFDPVSAGTRISSWSETASASPVTITNGYTFNGTVLPTRDYQYTFGGLVTSSPSGKLQLEGIRQPGSVNGSGNNDVAVFVNAIRLVAYPTGTQIVKTEFVGDNVRITVQGEYPGQPIYLHQSATVIGGWADSGATVIDAWGPIVVFEVPKTGDQMFYRPVSYLP